MRSVAVAFLVIASMSAHAEVIELTCGDFTGFSIDTVKKTGRFVMESGGYDYEDGKIYKFKLNDGEDVAYKDSVGITERVIRLAYESIYTSKLLTAANECNDVSVDRYSGVLSYYQGCFSNQKLWYQHQCTPGKAVIKRKF